MANPKFFFDSRFEDATPVASTTATGYDASNIADRRVYTWHKPSALPMYVRVNCGSSQSANYAYVNGHDLFTHGCTFEVRGSTDNFATSDVLVATKTPTTNKPFLLEFTSVSYQYWEYKITGGATMPSIAVAMIGVAFEMPSQLPAGHDPIGREFIGQTNLNDNGHPLGKIFEYEKAKRSLTFNQVDVAWIRSTFIPAWESDLRGKPAGYAWDSEFYPDELLHGLTGNTFSVPHNGESLCTLSFDFGGVA